MKNNIATKGRLSLKQVLTLGLLLVLMVELSPFSSQAASLDADSLATAPAAVSSTWWAAAQENIRRSEYHVTWQEKTYLTDVLAAYQAPNRAHNLRTYFTAKGPVVIPRLWPEGATVPPWRWGLRLVAWGREGALQLADAAILHTDANRIEYRRGDLTEWYVNDERGLEQGFTLQSPPLARSSSPLLLELALSGDLSPHLADDGAAVEFATPGGVRVLRYSDLHVTDATGHELAAHMQLAPSPTAQDGLHMVIDDAHAVYPIHVDPVATTPNWTAVSDQAGASFGVSVGTAGDVNGDGFSDVIVGADGYDNGTGGEGLAFVYHGSICGLSTAANWQAESNEYQAHLGVSVGTAGDVNNDGYADVIVGSSCYGGGAACRGAAFVWYGSATGLGANGTPSNADWVASGASGQESEFGSAVGTAGDVNGDGYDDVIVGAQYYENGQAEEGAAYVWHGSASGLGADGTPSNADWSKESDQMYAHFGVSVGTAGDVNGDGYDEVIVGAPDYDHPYQFEGLAFVYAGSASGLSSAPYWHAESNLVRACLGSSVGTAGDVNGDGYADVIVGAYLYSVNHEEQGAAFVWYGSAAGLGSDGTPGNADWYVSGDHAGARLGSSVGTAGDVNGDGYDEVIVGADNDNDDGKAFIYRGSSAGLGTSAIWNVAGDDDFGQSVGTAGDVNGDGYADVIVGDTSHSSGGAAYVYRGSASGPSPDWIKESDKAGAYFGGSVATAGDVNGDGYAEVIVGAPGYDGGQPGEGLVFVYAGSASGPNPVPYWHAESNQDGAHLGYSVGTAGDVNGDGYADVIAGASSYTHGTNDEGAAFVWHGSATGLGADGTPDNADWTAESDRDGAYFGVAVGTAGDVNGDGYSDVVVGAYYFNRGSWGEGAAFVWYGSATGLGVDGTPYNADWVAEGNQDEALLGCSVGTAGDVNGDGYADLIIGADSYTHDGVGQRGMALVWYGSASGLGAAGTPDNADWTALGNRAMTYLGSSVGTAGDVNGDGYADVIVGASGYYDDQFAEGGAFIWYGSASGLGADGTPANADWSVDSDQGGASFGNSVGTAGDVNGDGYADVVVGAANYEYGYEYEGRVYFYYGSDSGPSESPAWTVEGNQADAHLGVSVGTAGDVNGDGYADVIVGADDYDHGQTNEGRAYVFYGSATVPSSFLDWVAVGAQEDAHMGYSVGTAGDVNGDGYADVIVGADDYDNGQANEGAAFVWYGSATGLGTFGTPPSAPWSAEGDQAYAQFGTSVGTAGDVNGDGYADVIVGASKYDNGQEDEGRVYVYHGSATGLSTAVNWTAESDQASAFFGCSAGAVGDVNGDGYSDVIVGADGYDNGQEDEGAAFVWHGSDTGLGDDGTPANADWAAESDQVDASFGAAVGTAGDVNGDGYADVIVGADRYTNGQDDEGAAFVWHGSDTGLGDDGTPTNADWSAESGQADASFGLSAGTAGDVNGDGYADVIVGAYRYDGDETDEGRAYVCYGSSSGLRPFWSWTALGGQEGAYYGHSVGTAGDVNGDGYADVIVGATNYDVCYLDQGRAFLYLGSGSGLSEVADWTAERDQEISRLGRAVGTAGDVNGDGYADVIVGAYHYLFTSQNEGAVFVYYGNGGAGLSLNPRQRRTDDSAPIAHLGAARGYTFRLALWGRSPFGRGQVKLEWEVKPLGTPFSGTDTSQTDWLDSGTAGVEFNELAFGLSDDTAYHWRARLHYHPATTPFQQHGRWVTMPWNGWNEQDLCVRTDPTPKGGVKVFVPLVLRNSDGG
jgi:hypothetical protein